MQMQCHRNFYDVTVPGAPHKVQKWDKISFSQLKMYSFITKSIRWMTLVLGKQMKP